MNLNEFSDTMGRMERALRQNIRQAEARSVKEAKQAFVKRSSGMLSTKQLRQMGHPFATRAPQPGAADPTVINDQGGPFKQDWTAFPPTTNGAGTMQSSVINLDPKAPLMFGTARMIKRGIDDAVADEIEPKRLQYHSQAIDDALDA
jgi:hypothetical protein